MLYTAYLEFLHRYIAGWQIPSHEPSCNELYISFLSFASDELQLSDIEWLLQLPPGALHQSLAFPVIGLCVGALQQSIVLPVIFLL